MGGIVVGGTVIWPHEIMWIQTQSDIVTDRFSRDSLVVYEVTVSIKVFGYLYLAKSYNV